MTIADQIKQANIHVHRREAAIYDSIHPEIFGPYEQCRIVRDLDLIKANLPEGNFKKVLDVGCGTGNLTLKFARMGYSVKAMDISAEMLEILKSKIDSTVFNQVECILGDAEEFLCNESAPGEWDIISFSSVLHHLPDYASVVRAAVKKLKPGGILYVCHEPVGAAKGNDRMRGSFGVSVIKGLDLFYIYVVKACAYLRRALKEKTVPARMDYSLSDYHVESGINVTDMMKNFDSMGVRVLFYETYYSHFCAFLTRFDDILKISAHSSFRLIAQRHYCPTDFSSF
jgi:ubiquinone/menaquinone biosynthesis C-methylase UbiE